MKIWSMAQNYQTNLVALYRYLKSSLSVVASILHRRLLLPLVWPYAGQQCLVAAYEEAKKESLVVFDWWFFLSIVRLSCIWRSSLKLAKLISFHKLEIYLKKKHHQKVIQTWQYNKLSLTWRISIVYVRVFTTANEPFSNKSLELLVHRNWKFKVLQIVRGYLWSIIANLKGHSCIWA